MMHEKCLLERISIAIKALSSCNADGEVLCGECPFNNEFYNLCCWSDLTNFVLSVLEQCRLDLKLISHQRSSIKHFMPLPKVTSKKPFVEPVVSIIDIGTGVVR